MLSKNKLHSFFIVLVTLFLFWITLTLQKPKDIKVGFGVLAGDCEGTDGDVDILDFQALSNTFAKSPGDAGYNGRCNFNSDPMIEVLDFQILSNNFGRAEVTLTPTPVVTQTVTPTPVAGQNYNYTRLTNPERTEVYNRNGTWVATFTNNSYTVLIAGSARTFRENTTSHTVSHNKWVRVLSQPFNGTVDEGWLTQKLTDSSPDILALHFQYIANAPPIVNQQGLQIAGDAHYGPAEGADFNDYLGVTWTYPDGIRDTPETQEFRSLDCSGYIRIIFGYRAGLPLSIAPKGGTTIPRRSFEIFAYSPGVVIIPKTSQRPGNLDRISVGDLVFFDSGPTDGQIDHVGLFIGIDSGGHYRFISSRKSSDGPTMGDPGGSPSTLDGNGYFPDGFRSVRRL